ncbi:MAG: DUF6441 family protein [Magnetospirillum sp. WYHS-4]
MRLEAALEGDLKRFLADELKAAEAAVTAGVRAATEGLKQDLRRQIVGAGLGQRLWANASPAPGGARSTRGEARACGRRASSSARRPASSGPMRRAP